MPVQLPDGSIAWIEVRGDFGRGEFERGEEDGEAGDELGAGSGGSPFLPPDGGSTHGSTGPS